MIPPASPSPPLIKQAYLSLSVTEWKETGKIRCKQALPENFQQHLYDDHLLTGLVYISLH